MKSEADVIIYGGSAGSGKSHLGLMLPLKYIGDPNLNVMIFRRITKQIKQLGGLWDESKKMYDPFGITSNNTDLKHVFDSGATVEFSHLQYEDSKLAFQGGQQSLQIWDELTHFTPTQFTYLMSRLRSDAGVNGKVFATCNPDPDSWVLDWIDWYLDEEGYPDKSKQGVVRYYYMIEDKPVFGSSAEELMEKFPDQATIWNGGEAIEVAPKSFEFISGTIFDNQILIKKNPKYLAELNALPHIEKARLLYGNWYMRPQASGYFNREWLAKIDKVPEGSRTVRAWDKAATEPSEVNRFPDFTASIQISKDRQSRYYISGNYHADNKDKVDPEIHGRFRRRSGDRDNLILKQTQYDGEECIVIFPQDAGASGVMEFQESSRKLNEEGFVVKKDPTPPARSKLVRFTPFASACENGLVSIIEGSFDRKGLEAFYKELEAFDGERSTTTKKDDQVDVCASGFNYLSKQKVLPAFSLSMGSNSSNGALAKTK